MTFADASIEINERLSKLSSFDYDNITPQQKSLAINKAVIEFVREVVKEEDEVSRKSTDDIQVLLKNQKLSIINRDVYVETYKIPSDYLFFKRLTPICSKGNCSNVKLKSTLREEANVDELLQDYNSQPSFDFEETFHTIIGNRFRVYHNKDFDINEASLVYYRKPETISHLNRDRVWEWKDDVADVIIDKATKILAGDTSNSEVYQTATERINKGQ